MDVKRILYGLGLLLISTGCFCGEPRGNANLYDEPTDGGELNGVCDGSIIQAACVRDGDYQYYACPQGQNEPRWHECADDLVCWGARDTQTAECVQARDVLDDIEYGIEPGSDWWLDEKAREEATGGGGSSTCCKTCRTSKACGDTCISRSKSCNVGRGCACNG